MLKWFESFVERVFHKTPTRIIIGLVSMPLAISNILDQTSGVANIVVNVMGISSSLFKITMLAMFISGILLVFFPWKEKREPEFLYTTYALYVAFVTIGSLWLALSQPSQNTTALFFKTSSQQIPLLWFLYRELTWPD